MKAGNLTKIDNTNRRFGEGLSYYQLYDTDGTGYVFTREQLDYARMRYDKNPEDTIPFTPDHTFYYIVVIALLLLANMVQFAVYAH